jgi:uncharacterized membrane protein
MLSKIRMICYNYPLKVLLVFSAIIAGIRAIWLSKYEGEHKNLIVLCYSIALGGFIIFLILFNRRTAAWISQRTKK